MYFLIRKIVKLESESRERVNLEGRSHSHMLSLKTWPWLRDVFLKPSIATLTGFDPAPGSKLGIGSYIGEIPVGESQKITGNLGDDYGII